MKTHAMTVALLLTAVLLGGCGVSSRYRCAYPSSFLRGSYPRETRFVSKAGEEFKLHAEKLDSFSVRGSGLRRADPESAWIAFSGSVPLDSIALVAEPGVDIVRSLITMGTGAAMLAAVANASGGPRGELTAHFHESDGSCPFIYSYDGSGHVLDAEPFAGAVFQGIQRTTFHRLDHAEVTDGALRLRITCEMDETEYIDHLRLLAVDHAPGTVVVPTEAGRLCVLDRVEAPTGAVDTDGADVIHLVARADGLRWEVTPHARDARGQDRFRAGMTVTFRRPRISNEAVVVIDLQNTPWGSMMLREVVSQAGRDHAAWYASLNGCSLARDAFTTAMRREAMLHIAIQDGSRWRSLGHLHAAGHGVHKTVAVPLDLSGVSGDSVTLRLDSGAGFWAIDQVGIGFSPADPLAATVLDPVVARDHRDRDIRDALRAVDGTYYAMPTMEDRAELVFDVPQHEAECQRSFVLEASGYYTLHTDPDGEPRNDLLAKFLLQQGALCAYSIERYQDMTTRVAERDSP